MSRGVMLMVVLFLVAGFGSVEVESTSTTTSTITDSFTACTNQLLPELPNLSHAKSYNQVVVPNATCTTNDIISFSRTFTWYYYEHYPVNDCPENQCCFNTSTSLVKFTNAVRNWDGSNIIVTSTGNVTQGTYYGNFVIYEVVLPVSDEQACLTPQGLQIRPGIETLTIAGGPTCTGFILAENCPGIRF